MEHISDVYPYVYEIAAEVEGIREEVVLDKRENLDEVSNEITEVSGFTEFRTEGGLPTVFSFIQFIGMILTIILLITVIVMMIIIIGNDIGGRKKEIAIYGTGIYQKNIICILGTKYAVRLILVLFVSFIAVMITLKLENLGIQNLLSFCWYMP